MKLPAVERAIIDPAKVRDYLLAPDHPVGRSKERFFAALGFRRDRWEELRDSLVAIAQAGDAEPGHASPFGQKYVVRGTLEGPAGRRASVETVWIVLGGEDVPRLITAYPGDRQ